jgi:N-acetylglucosamine-6-phosphate deacetylase
MDACVRNLAAFTSISLGQAIKAATFNVAQMLGGEVAQRKGSLDVGKDADLVVLSPEGYVKSTWIMGKRVYGDP